MTILNGLNKKQKEAVEAPDGPLLILAGAGSGKTMTLTRRIAYLIRERNISPGAILAVTFTNKAAEEMRNRISSLLGNTTMPVVGTFHSVCVRFLRRDSMHIGRAQNFTIIDAADQLTVIRHAMKDLSLDPKQLSPQSVRASISQAKNNLLSASDFMSQTNSYHEELVARIYVQYEKALIDANAFDFDDLIVYTVKLFEDHPEVLDRYHHQFSHILVDEYQDTNHMQYRFVTLLAQKNKNLFIIGDDYQSIYMFRSADITNILNFEKDYSDAKIVTLEQNYRSTQVILDAATAIIHKNENQRHKTLWTQKDGGETITLYTAPSERGEAQFVATAIEKHHSNGSEYRDIVVLYRTNAQSRAIEEALMRSDISYRMVGGTKFYERKEIKDILCYLRLILNSADRPALERIINIPARGIGAKTLAAWQAYALIHDTDPLTIGLDLKENDLEGVSIARKKSIADFSEMISKLRDSTPEKTLTVLIADIYDTTGYKKMLASSDNSIESESRHENIGELITIAKEFKGDALSALSTFLEQSALAADTDNIDRDEDAVHLMTLHSAKGLEFPIVFIIGLEEGLLPHSRAQLAQRDLEEERRLLYVGMTRAKERLYLIHAHQRMVFGSMQANAPSRFLEDIPEELCEKQECKEQSFSSSYNTPLKHRTVVKNDTNTIHVNTDDFADGTAVAHPEFGSGIIVAKDDLTYTIAFAGTGIKKISKEFEGLVQS